MEVVSLSSRLRGSCHFLLGEHAIAIGIDPFGHVLHLGGNFAHWHFPIPIAIKKTEDPHRGFRT